MGVSFTNGVLRVSVVWTWVCVSVHGVVVLCEVLYVYSGVTTEVLKV